jgi:hypothetical protein
MTDRERSRSARNSSKGGSADPPGTRTKDRTLRPVQYAGAGIKCFWRVENEDDAMVVYTFELLPEGTCAPAGVFPQPRQARPSIRHGRGDS